MAVSARMLIILSICLGYLVGASNHGRKEEEAHMTHESVPITQTYYIVPSDADLYSSLPFFPRHVVGNAEPYYWRQVVQVDSQGTSHTFNSMLVVSIGAASARLHYSKKSQKERNALQGRHYEYHWLAPLEADDYMGMAYFPAGAANNRLAYYYEDRHTRARGQYKETRHMYPVKGEGQKGSAPIFNHGYHYAQQETLKKADLSDTASESGNDGDASGDSGGNDSD